jgi:predicted nucleic acid-binding protein
MPFVLDASIAATWALVDEDHPVADLAFDRIRADQAVVPTLWWFEIRNMLITAERRRRITEPETTGFLRDLSRLKVTTDSAPQEAELLALSRRHRLSVYDAAYLELGTRTGLPLATLDAALLRAAEAENLPLLTPAP